jgi:hypothetical protein
MSGLAAWFTVRRFFTDNAHRRHVMNGVLAWIAYGSLQIKSRQIFQVDCVCGGNGTAAQRQAPALPFG